MFYTYYAKHGNKINIRYKNDNDPQTKTKTVDFYKPTLYKSSVTQTDKTDINNNFVESIELDSMKEARSFGEEYKQLDGFGLCGNSDYANQFIIELFDGKPPEYNADIIRGGFIDIEVHSANYAMDYKVKIRSAGTTDIEEISMGKLYSNIETYNNKYHIYDEVKGDWTESIKESCYIKKNNGGFPHAEHAKYEINAVTLYDTVEKRFFTLGLEYEGCGGWEHDPDDPKFGNLKIDYFGFNSEKNLLRSLLNHIQERGYDLISGWNSEGFDVPYIVNRCYNILGEAYTKKMLSPFGKIQESETTNSFGQKQIVYSLVGLPHLDYMQVYKKHTYTPRESYRLDFIAHAELGENKLSYDEVGDLQELYRTNYKKFIYYNIHDVNILKRLDEKLGLLSLVYAMTYYTLCNYEETSGTVKIWEKLVAKFLYSKNKVPPFNKPKATEEREFVGGFVKQPVKGFNDWVITYDLRSLYPHIIQQWQIDGSKHVPYNELPGDVQNIVDNNTFDDLLKKKADLSPLKNHKLTMAANFECYSTDGISFMSEINRELYDQRKHFQGIAKKAKLNVIDVEKEMIKRGLM